MTDELLEEILCIFASERQDMYYEHLQEPFHQDGYIVATNINVAIRVKNNETSKVYETYLKPNVVGLNWEPNTKIRIDLDFLDALKTEKEVIDESEGVECGLCEGQGYYSDIYYKGTYYEVECPVCNGTGIESYTKKTRETGRMIIPNNIAIEINNVTFDPNLLYKLREVVKLTGQECHLLQNHNGNFVGTMFEVGIFEMIVMPKIFDKEDVKIIKLV